MIQFFFNYTLHHTLPQDHGREVVCNPRAPSASSSSQPANPIRIRSEVVDVDGNVEVTCDARGYVYKPNSNVELGTRVSNSKKQKETTVELS